MNRTCMSINASECEPTYANTIVNKTTTVVVTLMTLKYMLHYLNKYKALLLHLYSLSLECQLKENAIHVSACRLHI